MTTALGAKNSRRRFATHQNLPWVFGEAIKKFSAQTAWSIRQRYKRKNEKQQLNQFISFRKKNVVEKISTLCEECDKKFGEYFRYLEEELENIHTFMKETDISEGNKRKLEQQFSNYLQHIQQIKQQQQQTQQQRQQPQYQHQQPQPKQQPKQHHIQQTNQQQQQIQQQQQPQQQHAQQALITSTTSPIPPTISPITTISLSITLPTQFESTPTPTPKSTNESTQTPILTPTHQLTSTTKSTPTPTNEPTPTLTPTSELTPIPTPTSTPTPTHKPKPIPIPTPISTNEPLTPTSTPTPTDGTIQSQQQLSPQITQQLQPPLHFLQTQQLSQTTLGPSTPKDPIPAPIQSQQKEKKEWNENKNEKEKEKEKKKKEKRKNKKQEKMRIRKKTEKGNKKKQGRSIPVKSSLKRKLEDQQTNYMDRKQDFLSNLPQHPKQSTAPIRPLTEYSFSPTTSPSLERLSQQIQQSLQQQQNPVPLQQQPTNMSPYNYENYTNLEDDDTFFSENDDSNETGYISPFDDNEMPALIDDSE